jgi:hypothetical protein
MMRLKVEKVSEGLHPSEAIVSVKTSSGSERVVVSARSIEGNTIPVGWPLGKDNIDSNAEALIRVCATQELGLPTDTKVAEISGWCVQGAQPLVIDGHDPSNYRLKKMAA